MATIPLTRKQKIFAEEMIAHGNKRRAALKAYDVKTPESASVIATLNLKKVNVQEYINSFASQATSNIQKLANGAKNEGVRLQANKDMLDRAGYKPKEAAVNITINADLDPDQLRRIAARVIEPQKDMTDTP